MSFELRLAQFTLHPSPKTLRRAARLAPKEPIHLPLRAIDWLLVNDPRFIGLGGDVVSAGLATGVRQKALKFQSA